MLTNLTKAKFDVLGAKGLPENYPTPLATSNSLFYIQRNLNTNTVVYDINRNLDGNINENFPMHPYWIKYSSGEKQMELNFIQNKLAFGYESKKVSKELFQFEMVSYRKIKFFLSYIESFNEFKVVTKINGENAYLSNIYVFANEMGLFPDVKYFELYGEHTHNGLPVYQKIKL